MAAQFGYDLVSEEVINDIKGRGLIAKSNFNEDDIILEESPIVGAQFCWNKLYKYKACDYCLKSLETAEEMARRLTNNSALVLPHPECCNVNSSEFVVCPNCEALYCCVGCRDIAWSEYHMGLCLGQSVQDPNHPVNKLEEIWRNLHYPPETASISLVCRILAILKKTKDKQRAQAMFSKFVKSSKNEEEEIAHKMLGAQFTDQLEILRAATAEAFLCEDLHEWLTPEGFQSLFAMIGTNGQGIGTSSISEWVKRYDALDLPTDERQHLDAFIDQLYIDLENVSGTFLNCEGSGLYSRQSSCNHSCVPNAEITFPKKDHRLVLVALKHIQPGEEICISYIDECGRSRSRHSRQKILRENYLFTCQCEKCLAECDDPDCTSSEDDMDDDDDYDDNHMS